MKKIALAILNWNGRNLLERYLPTVVQFSQEADIWLVDNNSDDDSVSWTRENFPEVRILELESNFGYADGYNKALQEIKNEWVGLVNSDIRVTENWLFPLLSFISSHPDAGAIQPKVLDDKDMSRFEYAGASGGFLDRWGYPFCRGRIFDSLEEDKGQYDTEMEVHWATGACLLVNRQVYLEAKGLDGDFFAHMEEIDLCWRMQRIGKRIFVVPKSKVYHLGGGTLSAQNSRKTYLNFRNNLFLLYKNLDLKRKRTLLGRMVLDGISGLKFLLAGKPAFALAILKAHFHFYSNLSSLKRKRQSVKGMGMLPIPHGWYSGSIVWAHFIRRVKRFSDLDKDLFW